MMLSNLRFPKGHYTLLSSEDAPSANLAQRCIVNILHFWRELVIILLYIACAILTFSYAFQPLERLPRTKVSEYHIKSEDTRWRKFQWNTNIYSSEDPIDDIAVNTAWDQIVPAFGFVAMDHIWAAEHNLPASMSLPSDSSKGVYIIDAYHQIHCLTIIRKTMMELSSGLPLSVPMQHSQHCFDSLLQYIMCGNSGDTLLYTWGRNETGDGQLRRCIDWDSRKKWAHENTACCSDGDHPIPLFEHFNHCEKYDDGIQMYGSN